MVKEIFRRIFITLFYNHEKRREFDMGRILEQKNGFKHDKLIQNIRTDNKRNKLLFKKNIIMPKRNLIESNIIIFNLLIIIELIIKILSNNKFHFTEYNNSKITLKLKGITQTEILNKDFPNFDKLKEVNINGISQTIKKYEYTFNKTDNIIELIFEDYINNCENMFRDCSAITEIDLSNFDSSEVTNMCHMFSGCTSLTSINFTYFRTSKVKQMDFMFYQCISLLSLNLSSFDTSEVTLMDYMFSNCRSLSSLDLSNFQTSNVQFITYMFSGSINLEYINLINFNTNSLIEKYLVFYRISNNPVVCINENNILLPELVADTLCYTRYCSDDWKSKQKKIINNKCYDSCENKGNNIYEYNGKCNSNCINDFYIENDIKKCKCEQKKCFTCPPVALNKNLCTKCNEGYYQKENDPSNMGEYFDCHKEPDGYYLDEVFSLYKKCYNSCKTCKRKGSNTKHNCIECNQDFPIEINFNDYKNCYKKCDFYYYIDNKNDYHCTNDSTCPNEYRLFNDIYCIKEINNVIKSTEIFAEKKESEKLEISNETNREGKKSFTTIIKTQKITQNYDNIDIIQSKSDLTIDKIKEKEVQYYDYIIQNFEKLIIMLN